ncbi:MAG: PQQ-like beta-propeller repeat protein [Planctomycetaceae bacterium]|nr:PQQ-like beta-propeller repeat protein [Planctomycetaceae bacterium]
MLRIIRRQFCLRGILLSLASGLTLGAAVSQADDWPDWGGPERDCVWHETGIVDKLPTEGLLPRVWSAPVAEGYSGPAVANGRVFLTDRMADAGTERVLCFDADSGKQLWKHEYPVRYTVSYPAGPRATPVVAGGVVYTVGAEGHMFCLAEEDGRVIWKKEFQKDYATPLPTWGMAASPLVYGDSLITLVGGSDGGLVICFDRKTGEEKWRSLDDPEIGYCPPVIYEFDGVPQLIIWHPSAVSSLDPSNGSINWEVPWSIKAGLCVPMPRKLGQQLFLTSFYNGPLMLKVNRKSADIVWKGKSNNEIRTDGLHSIMPTPVVTESAIYGVCSYGQLRCLNTQTGERVWETLEATGSGRWWNAFLIPNGDRYFIHNEQGELIIAQLSAEGYKETSRALLVEPTRPVQRRMTIWSHPAFAMKSVFARNDKELVRVDLSKP